MCDITKHNLASLLPEIENAIKSSSFVAIDAEFTGLHASFAHRPNLFDGGAERYNKLRRSIKQIMPCQIGVAAFVRDRTAKSNKYVAHTFNCYIFPASLGPIDVRFICQSSCLEFLTKHKFDFNKFVYDGISLMGSEQESRVTGYLSNKEYLMGLERDINERELQDVCSAVAEWLVKGTSPNISIPKAQSISDFDTVTEVRGRFPNVWAEVIDDSVEVRRVGEEERASLEKEFNEEQSKKKLDEMLGFTQIFRMILNSKKPVVGHNCFMDLLLLYDKCIKYLPENYSAFKEDLHSLIPCIYDTKHIANYLRTFDEFKEKKLFEETSLLALYNSLTSEDSRFFSLFSPDIEHSELSGHYVFLQSAHLLATKDTKSLDAQLLEFKEYTHALRSEKNRVNLIRAGVHFLQLDGPDPESLRPQWLYVKSLNDPIRPFQIAQHFSPHGSVDVQMKSSRHALVAVTNYASSREILEAFKKHDKLYVRRYRAWKHSPLVRNLLLAGVAVSTSLCVWSILSSRQK